MKLKKFIFEKGGGYHFKTLNIKEKKIYDLEKIFKKQNNNENKKFVHKLRNLPKDNIGNFLFLLRVLDFRLWEFSQNWKYRNEKGFWGLVERIKDLFKIKNQEIMNFNIFKKIISPKENIHLSRLRYKLFRKAYSWLRKNYKGNFDNYFEENKNPFDFCFNLFKLEKFRDYYKNLYFLKPNQLLYYEYILGKKIEKKFASELENLTIFADYKIPQIFINLGLIEVHNEYLKKLNCKKLIRSRSKFENELRWGSIILGEKISKKFHLPPYLVDSTLWSLSHKIKMNIPYPLVKTIFY